MGIQGIYLYYNIFHRDEIYEGIDSHDLGMNRMNNHIAKITYKKK